MYYILHKDGKLVGVSNTKISTTLRLEGVSFEVVDGAIPDLNTCFFGSETLTIISHKQLSVSKVKEQK